MAAKRNTVRAQREAGARIATIRACVLCRSRVYGGNSLEEAINCCDCYMCPLWPYRPVTDLASPLPDNVIQFTVNAKP